MLVFQIIAERVEEIGIPKSELARRLGMNGELLRRSLLGQRKITADEFVCLCNELELELSDFEKCYGPKRKRRRTTRKSKKTE